MNDSFYKLVKRRKFDNNFFSELVRLFESKKITEKNIIELTLILADSGCKIKPSGRHIVADIPSTGGPSSLSTILCPLLLRLHKAIVPKLTVPGRPAGGIDILAQINNYKINPTVFEIKKILSQSGYVHFIGSSEFTPLDSVFFEYRKQNNKVAIPTLAIASILSKKIALGITHVGLDIRFSKFNNFGVTPEETERNAILFYNVAAKLGISANCFISDGTKPYQPFIGRGEALIAVKQIFDKVDSSWLRQHFNYCYSMVLKTLKQTPIKNDIISLIKKHFILNLESQGSSFNEFIKKVNKTEKEHLYKYFAPKNGYLFIDLNLLRNTIINSQLKNNTNSFPDTCGFILFKNSDDFVFKGELIATFRVIKENFRTVNENLDRIFNISDTPGLLVFSKGVFHA